jgi:hypothetical protein
MEIRNVAGLSKKPKSLMEEISLRNKANLFNNMSKKELKELSDKIIKNSK